MAKETGRILFVATVARHLLAFHVPYLNMFQQWGYEVESACDPAGEAEAFDPLGVKLNQVPFGRRPLSWSNLRALICLVGILKHRSYALVHVHTPVASFLTRLAARLCGFRPVLYTAHGLHFFKGAPVRNWLFYYPMEWLAARWTDGMIVLNEEDLTRARGLPVRGEVFLIPGVGVTLEAFDKVDEAKSGIRQELDVRPDVPVAVAVAEFSRVKNHEQVLRAWREVVRTLPQAVLLLAGEGERRRAVENLARDLGVWQNVRFLGFRNDVPRVIACADVVVLTSKREGLPRVILEAMAAAKPVVATNVRGNRDLVADKANGFLVEVGDAAGTATALVALLQDKNLGRRMGDEGKKQVQAYDLSRVREEMAGIYRFYLAGEARRKNGGLQRS
ncbi:MAG: glycosyltransferase family 1 protein [Ammonifex sp.]|jgi:glycosyltransferase involved in cell wall biosynthesis|nr:MAG: glycosyltransferase family 1 protein [Ammonifex sp.]